MRKKGFTLIELIVVMAIISILVLFGMPKYKGYVEEARVTKLTVEAKELEKASQQYYIRNQDWPRLNDDSYTKDEVTAFGEKIYASTGKVIELEEDGNYYDIDYAKIVNYISKVDKPENYILQNPVGNIYSIDKPTEVAKTRLDGAGEDIVVEVPFEFTATFTNAGAIGRLGPTQLQLDTAYVDTSLESKVISDNGIQLWTVPKTGTYRIETYGAQGGNYNSHIGGKGAILKGDFYLTSDTQLKILVGQQGEQGSYYGLTGSGSGGGGTFVQNYSNNSLLIASGAGGGGGASSNGLDALLTTSGGSQTGTISPAIENGGAGINGGGGGGGVYGSSAGGGYYGNGGYATGNVYNLLGGAGGDGTNGKNGTYSSSGIYTTTSGGTSFINGGMGGYGVYIASTLGEGGFGGGASGGVNGVGSAGGGYSGGAGAGLKNSVTSGGYGGGSYNSGINQDNTVGNIGQGKVIITYVGE